MPYPVPRYTAKDPQYSIVCGGCRWHADHRCMGRFEVPAGIYAGTYTCSCTRCGGIKHEEEM